MKVKCEFKYEIYKNDLNNFRVVNFKILESDEILTTKNITVSGVINKEISKDWIYDLEVEESKNKKYPNTYDLINIELIPHNLEANVISFFSSNKFEKIGKVSARKIINEIGENSIEKLSNDPDLINKTSLSDERKKIIFDFFKSGSKENKIFQLFSQAGVSNNYLPPLTNKYTNDKLLKMFDENVYELLYENNLLPFSFCDSIARFKKVDPNSIIRTEAIIYSYIKKEMFRTGSTFIKIKDLEKKILKLSSNNDLTTFRISLNNLLERNILYKYSDAEITTFVSFKEEEYIKDRLEKLMQNSKTNNILKNKSYIELDKTQVKAIYSGINNPLTIIHGSPGTGKTTIIKVILDSIDYKKNDIALLAPTGKAANRITQKTGRKTKTLHKFLGWEKNPLEQSFAYNEDNIQEVKCIIIDEFSMVDSSLMYDLLVACPFLEKLILIGDDDQLPAIKPGNILNSLIKSNIGEKIYLENIYRQGEGSGIIFDAKEINKGNQPKFNTQDSIFLKSSENDLFKLYDEQLKATTQTGIQILAPMYKGEYGIDNINEKLQKIYNSKNDFIEHNAKKFYINDKVIQLINSVDYDVYNGEIGIIIKFGTMDNKKSVVVKYEFREIEYFSDDFSEMCSLGYAISIHKSQGSEFDKVIIVLQKTHKKLLNKKLVYTALTRAKYKSIVFGEKSAIDLSIKREIEQKRNSKLLDLLNN
ncbi:MAG: AAA family ATPase [Mycoplasma sp.]|nr:AAA family ATPase [Mycoplasma sp.]